MVKEGRYESGTKPITTPTGGIIMDRRTFIATGLTAGAAAISNSAVKAGEAPSAKGKFKLKYGPPFGMFKNLAGDDHIDQMKFMADEGFTAVFDNGLPDKPKELQNKIVKEAERLGLAIGPFAAYAEFKKPTFVTRDEATRAAILEKIKSAVEAGKRLNVKYAIIAPGTYATNMEWAYQTANLVENLKHCVKVCEPAGFVLLIEPLNNWNDHPGMFLSKIAQAYEICKAVNSPSCKIINDIYHQQITEGNLIPNIDMAWDEIAAFHIGDTPGRKEPTTGEINYRNIFRHIHTKGYKGVLCMEHGVSKPGKEGERAVIEAYRWCDNF